MFHLVDAILIQKLNNM